MKKYNVEVVWVTGFKHTYEITGSPPGTRADCVRSAIDHLENVRNIMKYTITNEDGQVIHEKQVRSNDE